jgi:3-dehydroquinate synthase
MRKVKTIKVNVKNHPYPIYIGYDLIKDISFYLKNLNIGNFGIIITSNRIYSLYKDLIKKVFNVISYRIIKVIDGEKTKSKKWLFKVIDEIIKVDTWNRKIFIICLGGGTIGDLGGFVASIYKRGIPYIQIPTTLLAQIDASIGGKTSIDLKEAKNILGTFYQPKAVFIDPSFLSTLNLKEIKEGIAEAIKYGIIKDESFFYFLKNHSKEILSLNTDCILRLIFTCAKIKAEIVEKDEKEEVGIRTILNFGHTFAHALETSLRYRKFFHGEAVSLGMFYASILSYLLDMCNFRDVWEVKEIIKLYSLPIRVLFNYLTLYDSMNYDKKFIYGKIRMVLLKKIGKVEVVEGIPGKLIKKSLKFFSS